MTFGAIKTRIADELVRPDLAAQIALAVADAISEAATYRFWFNEVRGLTFPILAGQDFYTDDVISQMSRIDELWITANGQRRNLTLASALDMANWAEGSAMTGEPAYYARQADGLLFHMVPDEDYTATLSGTTRFAPLANDADSNPYLVEGEKLTRALAKAQLFEDVIRDFGEADRQWGMANRQRTILLAETAGHHSTNVNRAFV